MRKIGVLDEVFQRRLADDVPVLQRLGAFGQVGVVDVLESLRMSETVSAADFGDSGAGSPRSLAGPNLVAIEAHAVGDPSALRPSVTEENCDGVVGMSGLRPDRTLDFATVDIDFYDVAGDQATFLRRVWADQDGVVPAEI